MVINDPQTQYRLLQFADSIGKEISRRIEKDVVKPLDPLYGAWVHHGCKNVKETPGFNKILESFRSLLVDNAEKKEMLRQRAPPEQFTFIWNAADQMVGAQVTGMLNTPPGGKKIPMMAQARMLQLAFKFTLSDVKDAKKEAEAFLDEVTKLFDDIKKMLPGK